MSGTIPLSLTQQFDEFGKPLKGGQLFLIQAGTVSTPQDGFQEPALVTKLPYPITLDAAGRIPQFFLADGFIKVRLQDARGVVQLASDGIQVIGPSSGGGGGTPVDPNALVQMGNVIARYGVGALPGYVRLNALSIGSAVSGATERANSDCQALFQFLWGVDPTLVVSGGRGASAAADWAANKTIALPDFRSRVPAGLGDMGNADAGLLPSGYFPAGSTVLGAKGGFANSLLSAINIPSLTSVNAAQSINVIDNMFTFHSGTGTVLDVSLGSFGGAGWRTGDASAAFSKGGSSGSNSISTTYTNVSPEPVRTIQPTILLTYYLKL